MEAVRYDHAFMFMYSERPTTYAARKYEDDVPDAVKKSRLNDIVQLQNRISRENNALRVGQVYTVLAEGLSKRSDEQLIGRTDSNHAVVFDRQAHGDLYLPGDYVQVEIHDTTSATLLGRPLGRTTLAASASDGTLLGRPAAHLVSA